MILESTISSGLIKFVSHPKKTSQGKRKGVSFSTMNKGRKRDFKPYRGQGR